MSGGGPAATPATHGGPGWKDRKGEHVDDVRCGRIWRRCGVPFEAAALRDVILADPGAWTQFPEAPDDWLMLERPDLHLLRQQARRLAACYEASGCRVEWTSPAGSPPPNFLFQRDLFFMTPEGAVLARPASEQRAGEPRWMAAALAALGVPILSTLRGSATFEGADALWLDPSSVLVGVGRRTNQVGFDQLRGLLGELGVDAEATALAGAPQHLLGVVNVFDRNRAVVRSFPGAHALRELLCARGFEVFDWKCEEPWGMNFVAIAPNRAVMPERCPMSRRALEELGVAVQEVDCSEYLKAAGGPACATGILWREAP